MRRADNDLKTWRRWLVSVDPSGAISFHFIRSSPVSPVLSRPVRFRSRRALWSPLSSQTHLSHRGNEIYQQIIPIDKESGEGTKNGPRQLWTGPRCIGQSANNLSTFKHRITVHYSHNGSESGRGEPQRGGGGGADEIHWLFLLSVVVDINWLNPIDKRPYSSVGRSVCGCLKGINGQIYSTWREGGGFIKCLSCGGEINDEKYINWEEHSSCNKWSSLSVWLWAHHPSIHPSILFILPVFFVLF